MMRMASVLLLLSLPACATVAQPVAGPRTGQSAEPVSQAVAEPAKTCRNDGIDAFVGQLRSEALATRLLAASGAKTLRWVAPGTMVTMDYRDDRLTIHLDSANRIERARCG